MLTILGGIHVGIQSWCFRALNGNNDNINALKKCNIDSIEICNVHVDVNNKSQVDEVIKLYKDNGITFSSCGINDYPNDESTIRNYFEFARKAGIKILGADPEPEAFDLIDRLCNEYGIKIAIHNHGRYHKYGSMKQLEEAFSRSTANIGLCLDTGWALDSQIDPVDMIRRFSNRLYGIHFKDFTFDKNDNIMESVLGRGELDLQAVLNSLKEIGFKGYVTLEYEGEPENPLPSIVKCLDRLKKVNLELTIEQ